MDMCSFEPFHLPHPPTKDIFWPKPGTTPRWPRVCMSPFAPFHALRSPGAQVDMMLPEGLVEQMIQAVTEEFYRRRPEDFFRPLGAESIGPPKTGRTWVGQNEAGKPAGFSPWVNIYQGKPFWVTLFLTSYVETWGRNSKLVAFSLFCCCWCQA